MNTTTWHHSDGEQTFGPLSEDQIISLVQSGQLKGDHFVLPEGSEDWLPMHASPFAGHLTQPAPVLEQPQQLRGVASARQPDAAAVPVRSPRPQPATYAAAKAHQGLNRNLLVLGSLALLVLGGLGFFLTTKMGGNIFNTKKNFTNQITNNSYFTQLIASGATTEKDLEAVTDIRPYGDSFIGISKEPLTWEQAQGLAKRTGAESPSGGSLA